MSSLVDCHIISLYKWGHLALTNIVQQAHAQHSFRKFTPYVISLQSVVILQVFSRWNAVQMRPAEVTVTEGNYSGRICCERSLQCFMLLPVTWRFLFCRGFPAVCAPESFSHCAELWGDVFVKSRLRSLSHFQTVKRGGVLTVWISAFVYQLWTQSFPHQMFMSLYGWITSQSHAPHPDSVCEGKMAWNVRFPCSRQMFLRRHPSRPRVNRFFLWLFCEPNMEVCGVTAFVFPSQINVFLMTVLHNVHKLWLHPL